MGLLSGMTCMPNHVPLVAFCPATLNLATSLKNADLPIVSVSVLRLTSWKNRHTQSRVRQHQTDRTQDHIGKK